MSPAAAVSTCPAASAATAARPRPRRALSAGIAFYLQASITLSFLAASSAPTPLYAIYQAEWGFSATWLTLVFGVYAGAVLAALLVVGRLSDFIGRRPVLLAAIAVQIVAMAMFLAADGVAALMLARVVQGLSAGAALAAVGAGLVDLDKTRGTIANSVAPPLGTGTGALVAGLAVQFLPAPTHLVYALLVAVLLAQAAGVFFMAESAPRRPGALASLRPHLTLPPAARRPMLVAAPALVAVWALAGFYASLGPSLMHKVFASASPLFGGLALFVLALVGALTVLSIQRLHAHTMMSFGASALAVGVAVSIAALSVPSLALFFFGTAVAGSGFGAAFQGAVRSVVPTAAPHERAGVLAVFYVISYLAMGLPAVAAGVLLTHGGGALFVAHVFGGSVIALALAALAGSTWAARSAQPL